MKRETDFQRMTGETRIEGKLNLDGRGERNISTGVGFFDHMLDLWAFHGGFDLDLTCEGDLDICPHHSIEDVGITLGQAFKKALGDCKGIQRYGTCYLPMDETLSRTVLDVSGRAVHIFHAQFDTPAVGMFPTEMVSHFFCSFAMNAELTLHQEILYGSNDHHKAEALFKGFAKALQEGVRRKNENAQDVPSTKGIL